MYHRVLQHLDTVHDVFDAGEQAAKGACNIDSVHMTSTLTHYLTALQAVHKCGWVHRDISSGNILLVDGVVKIADLEYAKKMDDETSHTGRSV